MLTTVIMPENDYDRGYHMAVMDVLKLLKRVIGTPLDGDAGDILIISKEITNSLFDAFTALMLSGRQHPASASRDGTII